jgi:hypothetical protein
LAVCVVVSVALELADAGGVHSVALRLAATVSLAIGVAVPLIRASPRRRNG